MQSSRLRVLLIGGQPESDGFIQNVLKGCRDPNFVVLRESSLASALDRIKLSHAFELILLDLDWPDVMGGAAGKIALLSEIRSLSADCSIVCLSDDEDATLAEKALDAGAQEFLLRGDITEALLLRTVRTAIARSRFERNYRERYNSLAFNLASDNQRMEEELQIARTMQFDLLPDSGRLAILRQEQGLMVESYFEPSLDLGGDLWGMIRSRESQPIVFTFDLSGHGVSASLNAFRLHALLSELDGQLVDPAEGLARLNQTLRGLLPRGHYATMFLGLVDVLGDRLLFSAAGSPRPILLDGEGGGEFLDSRGKPLGLADQPVYRNRSVPFPRGSSLFLYSDAMTESKTAEDVMLGEERLLSLVRGHYGPQGIDVAGLAARFFELVGSPLDDDITALAITHLADPGPQAHPNPANRPAAKEERIYRKADPPVLPPMLVASRSLEPIEQALAPPYHGFVEITGAGLADVGSDCLAAIEAGGICLSLSVGTAWSHGMAGLFRKALPERFGEAHDWDAVGICLHEAIANAIIHGSLGVRSGLRENRRGLEHFHEAVARALDDPLRAQLRVEAAVRALSDGRLEFTVSNRGRGFDLERHLNARMIKGAKHGRGLLLIQALAQSVVSRDAGRTLVFTI